MKIEIDQSGKIEKTNKLTIVAFSNGKIKSLKINSIEKQKVLKVMRDLGYNKKSFVLKTFATLVFLLIRDERAQEIVIDKEYSGNEATIKNIIFQLFRKEKIAVPEISFALISKQSQAHKAAVKVFRGEIKPDMNIKAKALLHFL